MSLPLIGTALKSAFSAIGSAGSALSAGLAVGQAGLGYMTQKGMAEAQAESTAQANERARMYMIEDQDAFTRMAGQEAAAGGQKLQQNQIAASKTAASAQVAATAGGVSGLSVDALLGDIFGQEASIRDGINQNLENTTQQIGRERTSSFRGYVNEVSTRQTPQRPSLTGAILEAGTGVVGAYKDEWKIRGKLGNP